MSVTLPVGSPLEYGFKPMTINKFNDSFEANFAATTDVLNPIKNVAQAGQIDECRLPEDVVAHHAHRKPRKVHVAAAFDHLREVVLQVLGLRATHEVLVACTRAV